MTRAFLPLFMLLALMPLVQLSSPGQDSMLTPSNVLLWCVAALFIGAATLLIYRNNKIILPRFTLWILALPAGFIASGFITGIEQPVDWVFRLGAILTGIGFFFALFQFKPNRRLRDDAIHALLVALILNGIISYLQLMPGKPLQGLIAHPEHPSALGVFMQPNLQASIMVTGLLLAIYQMTSPGQPGRNWLLRALPPTAVFVCSSAVLATGSRVGLLALAISLPLLLMARWPLLIQRKHWSAVIAAALILGFGAGTFMNDGLVRAYSKVERLTEEGTDARQHIYRIGWDLYTDKPIAGHGIGSFQSVFHQRAGEYMAERGSEPLIGHSRFSHPHNELLLWAIEGGSLALLGIMLATGAVLLQLWRQGRQRGLALFTLLIPLTLHTQVELPFYSSAYHWLIFLFLLFMVFRHRYRTVPLQLSRAACIMIPSTGLTIMAGILALMISTFSAGRHLTAYLVNKDSDIRHLQIAQDTLYFNEMGNLLIYKALLYTDFANNTQQWTPDYITWAEAYLRNTPETSTFSDLALAYRHLGDLKQAHNVLNRGLFIYPIHPSILETKKIIDQNKPVIPSTLLH